jgi:hypothetical protein
MADYHVMFPLCFFVPELIYWFNLCIPADSPLVFLFVTVVVVFFIIFVENGIGLFAQIRKGDVCL